MYLRPSAIGTLDDKEKLAKYNELAAELNSLPQVDYERVNDIKLAYVKDLYEQLGEETLASEEYLAFWKANEYWLKPYAAFCVLRDKKGTAEMPSGDDGAVNRQQMETFDYPQPDAAAVAV